MDSVRRPAPRARAMSQECPSCVASMERSPIHAMRDPRFAVPPIKPKIVQVCARIPHRLGRKNKLWDFSRRAVQRVPRTWASGVSVNPRPAQDPLHSSRSFASSKVFELLTSFASTPTSPRRTRPDDKSEDEPHPFSCPPNSFEPPSRAGPTTHSCHSLPPKDETRRPPKRSSKHPAGSRIATT
jgi:hypothetical protein